MSFISLGYYVDPLSGYVIDATRVLKPLLNEQYLLDEHEHSIVAFIFEWIYGREDLRDPFSCLFEGRGICWEIWGIGFRFELGKKLSSFSTIAFKMLDADEWDDEKGEPLALAIVELNMEEFYYYLELSYYLLLQNKRETTEGFAWYLEELAKFRQTCEIKDIYGERLQHFREEYGVSIKA